MPLFLGNDSAVKIAYSIFSTYHFPFSPYFCGMTITPFPFKVLFCFENETRLIVEIKRTDIQSEDKSLIYKWIFIQNEKQNENEDRISVLTFQSMESSGERQIRTFAEGILIWNKDEAVFNNEKLAPVDVQLINQKYLMLISDFLIR